MFVLCGKSPKKIFLPSLKPEIGAIQSKAVLFLIFDRMVIKKSKIARKIIRACLNDNLRNKDGAGN